MKALPNSFIHPFAHSELEYRVGAEPENGPSEPR